MASALLKRIFTILFGNGISKLMLVGFELFLATFLGPAPYGLFSISLAVLIVATNISLAGMDFGIIQYLAIYQEQKRDDKLRSLIIWALLIVTMIGLCSGLVVAAFSNQIASSLFHKPELSAALLIVGIIIPFETFNQGMGAVFRGMRQYRNYIIVSDLLRNLCLVISIPLTIWLQLSLSYTMLFLLAGSLMASAAGAVRIIRMVSGFSTADFRDTSVIKPLVSFSYLLSVWNVLQNVAGRSQIILAGIFLTSEQVGVFGIFLRMTLLFTFFQSATNQTISVEFARLHYLGQRENLKHMLNSTAKGLLLICLLLALPIVVSPTFVLQLLGREYNEYAWLLLPLLVAQVVNVGTGPIGQLLIGCGKQSAIFTTSMIGSIVQIILSVMLMSRYGLIGAVIAETTTNITLTILKHGFSYRLLGIHAFTRDFVLLLFGGAACAILGGYLAGSINTTVGYILGVLIALVLFLAFLFLYSFMDRPFQRQMQQAFSMVRAWQQRMIRSLWPVRM